jgi:predicted dehydrogenase
VHGTTGSLVAPAPNNWDGEVLLKRVGDNDFAEVPPPRTVEPGYMGMGLVDMAARLLQGKPPVASGQRGLHVLEVLRGIIDSAEADGAVIEITPVGADFIEWEMA